ncbi:MAG: signal peptidase I [Lachnospirales bacterium]
MENQKEKRSQNEGRDTKNLSELLEFDFNQMTEGSAETPVSKQSKKEENDQLDSFFVDDMGLPPLPESDAAKHPNLTMSNAFSKAQEVKQKDKPQKSSAAKDSAKTQTTGSEVPVSSVRRTWNIVKGVLVWSKEIIIALVLVWLLLTFVAQNSTVYGSSMAPTLENGEMILMNKFIYRFTEPQRGDIIVFTYDDPIQGEEYLIKRVIGLPGDTIEIMDGMVYINGTAYDESKYLEMSTEISGDISYPFLVPEDSYFVMGDNRANSKDSRFSEVGAVSKDQIVGKASIRFWPLDRIGFVQ